ncbi:hypothetical protein [Streptomyces rubiginosohelvolus]|uniref:hypothetical protein n=1 Tax=Streptomyces rubiginosohelvolus TaxID=67362 RepID=UPI00340E1ADD
MAEAHDQTYIDALGADLAQQNLNALVLAQNGNNQLGQPWTDHPGLRVWNGNIMRIGHHDKDAFVAEVNTVLPSHMYVDMAHHEHAHLTPLYPPLGHPRSDTDWNQWVHCAPNADGAIPLTIAITQTCDD